ncbi:major capsid family protein [Citrobacter amalonaticus]|uniref:major capsid family protein n=1 Tax=Citrobacter amalonaticus TaxID=35703 RepID=UPI0018AC86C6|nr:major capsid family protein [Citrobacter amalonaticus]
MAFESTDFEEVLQEALTERDTQLQERELPEINIGEAIPVTEGLDFALDFVDFGVSSVVGSVKDGIIGNKTNSLKTIDSEIEWLKAPVGQWAKAATWTQQELEKIARLNISLQSKKQDDLYANALATIQYAGYVGHQGVKGQEGLLTGKNVQLITDTSNKTIADMSSDEFVKLVLDAYNVAWRKSSYRIQPTNIAMDASDFMLAMQKFDPNPIIVGTDMLPIAAMDRIMAALRKASGNESFNISFVKVPSNYAVGIKSGKTRMAVYTYESDYVEMEVHMPELLAVRQRDLLTYECGYRSAFGGAMWKQPQSAVYVDYKSSPAE